MPRKRFTKAERELILKLRERHSAEAICREVQKIPVPREAGHPGSPTRNDWTVWLFLVLKAAKLPNVKFTPLSEELAKDFRCAGWKISGRTIRRKFHEIEDRIEREPEARELALGSIAAFNEFFARLPEGMEANIWPRRYKLRGDGSVEGHPDQPHPSTNTLVLEYRRSSSK
jgi:hypothetical protein